MKISRKMGTVVAVYGAVLAVALSGCLAGSPETFYNHKYVCNALGDESGAGIKGKLYYLPQSEVDKGFSGVSDFFARGTSPEVDFYMGRFYIPTKPFSDGFRVSNTGEMVKDLDGNELVENFAFRFKSKIRLPAGYAGRNMQFAIISDDGARFIVNKKQADGSYQQVVNINNDGNHAPRMGCGTAPVWVSSNEDLEIEVDYYQGPRYHIALTMIWREWPTSGSATDPYCGQTGTDLYWDSSTTPSTPKAAWNNLMTRWQVVPSEVFIGEADNPCAM